MVSECTPSPASCRLCVVQRISSSMHLVDPLTCQTAEISSEKYYRSGEFRALVSSSRLVEFTVLGWEAVLAPSKASAPQRRISKQRSVPPYPCPTALGESSDHPVDDARLAEVEVARSSDLGKNDIRYRVVTHLGHLVKAGDVVLGYDLAGASLNSDEADEYAAKHGLPDVILVRKIYSASKKWHLKCKKRFRLCLCLGRARWV
jgi:nonsense-mediated mRNA decay protein 3